MKKNCDDSDHKYPAGESAKLSYQIIGFYIDIAELHSKIPIYTILLVDTLKGNIGGKQYSRGGKRV